VQAGEASPEEIARRIVDSLRERRIIP